MDSLFDDPEIRRLKALLRDCGWLEGRGRSGQPEGWWTDPTGKTVLEADAMAAARELERGGRNDE